MAKKKASLKGRGAEVLFGSPVPQQLLSEMPEVAGDAESDLEDFGDAAGALEFDISPGAHARSGPGSHSRSNGARGLEQLIPTGLASPPGTQPDRPEVASSPSQPAAVSPQAGSVAGTPAQAADPANGPVAEQSASQPFTSQGGPVSNPTIPTPARPTVVVPSAPASPSGGGVAASGSSKSQPTSTASATPTNASGGKTGAATSTGSAAPATGRVIPVTTVGTAGAAGQPAQELERRLKEEMGKAETAQRENQQSKVEDARVKEFRERLSAEITSLYLQVASTIHDSPKVAEYCLDLLRQAREIAFGSDRAADLSKGEYYVQKVRAKLGHSSQPVPKSEVWHVRFILFWHLIALVLCLLLASLPWVFPRMDILVMQSIVIRAEFVPLLAALGWGGIGGVIGTLYNLPWFVQIREYDPAYNLDYMARPIKGVIVGGIIFLLFLAGIVTVTGSGLEHGVDKFSIVFLVAALSGFKQEYVFEMFDKTLQAIFRAPPNTPKQVDSNAVKK